MTMMIIVMMIGFYFFARQVSALLIQSRWGSFNWALLKFVISFTFFKWYLCAVGASVQETVPVEDWCA